MPVGMFGNLCEKLFSVMGANDTKDFRGLTERFALDAIGCGGFGNRMEMVAHIQMLDCLHATIIGFDFNAVLDKNSPWVVKYLDSISSAFDPFFLVFSFFDKRLRFLFPSRVRAHEQLSEFLLKMREIIDYKRRTLETSRDTIKDTEKDLLMLMIEAEKDGEAALTDDELMVRYLYYADFYFTYVQRVSGYMRNRATFVYSLLPDMTQQLILWLVQRTISQGIQ